MSWASIVEQSSVQQTKSLKVVYPFEASVANTKEDGVPREKELTPDPADDFVMINYEKQPEEERKTQTTEKSMKYNHLSNEELILLISGYIHNIQLLSIIPSDVIQCISLYHWSKLYDDFNIFRFKSKLKDDKPNEDFSALKYFVMPLNELKRKHLLPFTDVKTDENNRKIGKYSSFQAKYCPEFIKEEQCLVHEVELDQNNENIYHLMDSFVVNKFIQLFSENDAGNHWQNESETLPAGKGPYRAGFRCVGHVKQPNNSDKEYFNTKMQRLKLWKFIGGSFDKLVLNKDDFYTKCLLKQFDFFEFSAYDKILIDEAVSLLYAALNSRYGTSDVVTLDDLRWNVTGLNCKEVVCDVLYRQMKANKEINDEYWIIKKLFEMRCELNIDEKRKNQKESEIDDEENETKEEENELFKGNWTSWTEIEVDDNNICDAIYPFMMTSLLFSRNYSTNGLWITNGLRLSGMDYDDWTLQRPTFGNKFLELFHKNGKKNKLRAFWCQHIAWDMFDEDYLSGDKILCCIDDEKIVVIWSLFFRLYG